MSSGTWQFLRGSESMESGELLDRDDEHETGLPRVHRLQWIFRAIEISRSFNRRSSIHDALRNWISSVEILRDAICEEIVRCLRRYRCVSIARLERMIYCVAQPICELKKAWAMEKITSKTGKSLAKLSDWFESQISICFIKYPCLKRTKCSDIYDL